MPGEAPATPYQVYQQPPPGGIPPAGYSYGNNMVYPVQAVNTPEGSSGGLVNKSAQIIGAAQAGQNATNQSQQMQRAQTEFQKQQQMGASQQTYDNELANQQEGASNGAQPGQGQTASPAHAGFFSALENSPIGHVVGAAVHAIMGSGQSPTGGQASGIPAAPPSAAPAAAPATPAAPPGVNQGLAQGGPVVSGASTILGGPVPQMMQSAANGGPVTQPEFMMPLPPQPQPVMVGMEKGGVVGAPKLAKPRRSQGVYRTQRAVSDLNGSRYGVPGPTMPAGSTGLSKGASNPRQTGFGVTTGAVRGLPGFAQGGVIPANGEIPGFDAGGAIPVANVSPLQGSSGGLVNSSAQIIGAAQAGQNATNQSQQMARAGTQFSEDQHAGASAQQAYEALVAQHHGALHGMGLDDLGNRNDSQGVPTTGAALPAAAPAQPAPGAQPAAPAQGAPPAQQGALPAQPGQGAPPAQGAAPAPQGAPAGASSATPPAQPQAAPNPVQAQATAQAVQAAASNTDAQQGKPEQATAPAHSITNEEWDHLDALALRAAGAAAAAGHDGSAVYQALTATKNAWVQGHILRNLSAANVALQNGDQEGVKKALQDANYYLPNGQDLKIQTDKQGNMVYQDPISPYLDNGKPSFFAKDPTTGVANQPNMIPVDAAHLQQLGIAMLDPMNVQNTILQTRASYAAMNLEAQRGASAITTATARLRLADARATQADTQRLLVPSEALRNRAGADLDEARAKYAGALLQYRQSMGVKADPVLAHNITLAQGDVMDMARGTKTTDTNPTLPDGSPNPNYGKTTYDKNGIPAELRNADAATLNGVAAMAGELIAGNPGMPHTQAAQIALSLFHSQHLTHTEVLPGPRAAGQNTQTRGDVIVDKGQIWQWNPQTHAWNAPMPITPAGAQAYASRGFSGMVSMPSDGETATVMGGSSGGSGIPQQDTSAQDAADDASMTEGGDGSGEDDSGAQ